MKAIAIDSGFGIDNLRFVERPSAKLAPDQVRLRIKAVSLNYRDLLTIRGVYNPKQPLPLVPCSDAVGEVVEVGANVKRVAAGDRVCPIFAQSWLAGRPTRDRLRSTLGGPLPGTLAEEMVLSEEGVVHVPEVLSDEEAATLPCAAVTAWTATAVEGRVLAGQTVLVLGSGGVSVFALQFAKALGARVVALSGSDSKLERLRFIGAEIGINYKRQPQWGKVVKDVTDGQGVDLVVEVGGAQTLTESLKAVALGGTICLIGNLSGVSAPLNILSILMRYVKVQGIVVGHRDSFEAMNRAIIAHELSPVVHRTYPWQQFKEAFEEMERGAHFGKICLRID